MTALVLVHWKSSGHRDTVTVERDDDVTYKLGITYKHFYKPFSSFMMSSKVSHSSSQSHSLNIQPRQIMLMWHRLNNKKKKKDKNFPWLHKIIPKCLYNTRNLTQTWQLSDWPQCCSRIKTMSDRNETKSE